MGEVVTKITRKKTIGLPAFLNGVGEVVTKITREKTIGLPAFLNGMGDVVPPLTRQKTIGQDLFTFFNDSKCGRQLEVGEVVADVAGVFSGVPLADVM